MRVLIVGSSGSHNAEWFYARALSSLGAEVSPVDQYEGVRHGLLARLAFTRIQSSGPP
ncbi:MAG: hypothetical protein ACP5G6_09115 [Conexivisphaera sp.]|jgi:hypothetical protein